MEGWRSEAFQEPRDGKDVFDATLACNDEQIQPHKAIHSDCSSSVGQKYKKCKYYFQTTRTEYEWSQVVAVIFDLCLSLTLVNLFRGCKKYNCTVLHYRRVVAVSRVVRCTVG